MTKANIYPNNTPTSSAGKHPKDLKPPYTTTQIKPADPNYRNRPLNGSLKPNPIEISYTCQRNLTLDLRVPVAPVETKGGLSTPTVETEV